MRRLNQNLILPALIGAAVLVIALSLVAIVARSPYTHSNRNASFNPHYTRTEQTFAGPPVPFSGGILAVSPATDPVELGQQLFVKDFCATCHGLDGRGGIIGPSIIGVTPKKLRSITRLGPKGMPAFASGALSDDDLAAIAAFLGSTGK